MHIAWLGKKSPFCGNVTYSREVTNALLDRGHQVSFLHFAQEDSLEEADGTQPGSHHEDQPEYQEVSLPFLYKSQVYTIPTPKSSKVLAQALGDLKPDLVHASLTLSPLDFLLPEICEELNLPLVATFHPAFDRRRTFTSSTSFLMYQLYAPCLMNYDRVIIFSQIQRNLLIKLGVSAERVVVIPNGVDAQKYSPVSAQLKSYLRLEWQTGTVFVYQGRIAIEKNVEALLKAWKRSNLGRTSKLLLVGDGPLKPTLEPFYGPEDGICWLGYEADEQRRIQILRSADVFVLPSLVEGLSLSLLEAMACGLACVATDAGADGEVLEKEAGVVLKTESVTTQLKILLPQLRDHPSWVRLMGENARQRVLERYTLHRNISQLEMLYSQLLEKRSPKALSS